MNEAIQVELSTELQKLLTDSLKGYDIPETKEEWQELVVLALKEYFELA